MLIIGMPKSASTSLCYTVAKIAGAKCEWFCQVGKKDRKNNEYSALQKVHSNIVDRDAIWLQNSIKRRDVVRKDHLIPTQMHIDIVNNGERNIVYLYRSIADVMDSYRRCISDKRLLELIENDIYNWRKGWDAIATNSNIIDVDYNDLVLNYQSTIGYIMQRAEMFPPMEKKKYTGIGEKRLNK